MSKKYTITRYHNPENLPDAGPLPWRFCTKTEIKNPPRDAEFWRLGDTWAKRAFPKTYLDSVSTYRTREPLPFGIIVESGGSINASPETWTALANDNLVARHTPNGWTILTREFAESSPVPKCDGNHAGPPCGPGCWNDESEYSMYRIWRAWTADHGCADELIRRDMADASGVPAPVVLARRTPEDRAAYLEAKVAELIGENIQLSAERNALRWKFEELEKAARSFVEATGQILKKGAA